MLRGFLLLLATCLTLSVSAEELQLSLPDLKGKQHQLSDYRGKWVVVNYWATWCPPCLDEIPELVEFHEHHHANSAVVLGIDYEEVDKAYLKSFVEEYFISYPVLVPDLTKKSPFGRILGLPTTFVISPQGKLVNQRIGGVTRAWLESVISPVTVTQGIQP